MSDAPCPVCGHPNGACTGNTPTSPRMIIGADGVRTGRMRLPRPRSRRGRAGYVGEKEGLIDVYDPDYPNVNLVNPANEVDDPPSDELDEAPASCSHCGAAVGERHGDDCRYHGRVSELAAKRRTGAEDKRLDGEEDK